jgi:hypothetical protein
MLEHTLDSSGGPAPYCRTLPQEYLEISQAHRYCCCYWWSSCTCTSLFWKAARVEVKALPQPHVTAHLALRQVVSEERWSWDLCVGTLKGVPHNSTSPADSPTAAVTRQDRKVEMMWMTWTPGWEWGEKKG